MLAVRCASPFHRSASAEKIQREHRIIIIMALASCNGRFGKITLALYILFPVADGLCIAVYVGSQCCGRLSHRQTSASVIASSPAQSTRTTLVHDRRHNLKNNRADIKSGKRVRSIVNEPPTRRRVP